MNKVLVIMLMLVMSKCVSPAFVNGPVKISCETATLVLSTSGMDLPAFRLANEKYTYVIENDRIYVTLSSIPEDALPAWLYQYNPNVLFNESEGAILCHHLININSFSLGTESEKLTLKEVQEILIKKGMPLTDSFRQYVELSFNGKALELDCSDSFKPNKHFYYPMAFFMAVARTNSNPEAISFTFHKATYQGQDAMVIEVNSGGYQNYYDFAQYPPLR